MSYLKLDRKMLDWGWFSDPPTAHMWIYLLLKANYKKNEWHGVEVNAGELITSVSRISIETGLTVQQTRTALKKLESTNEITINSTNKYSHIRINKWKSYQTDNKQITNEATSEGTNEQQHFNNSKNIRTKEIIKDKRFVKPTVDDVRSYCVDRGNSVDAQKFVDYYSSNGWKVGKNPMKDWKAAVRTWERNTNVRTPNEDSLPTYDDSGNKCVSASEEEELLRLMGRKNI